LTTLDVNAGALAGDTVSEALVTAGGEVIDTAEILGAGLAKIAGVSFTTAYTAVVMSLADQIANTPGAALDLTAATTLQSILQSAATSVGLGTPIASNLATDLISLTAASNQAIVASVASLTGGAAVKALSAVEYVAQGETTSALQSGTNFDIVAADYTNGNLAQAIQAADGSVACYLKGVLILTPLGEIPVEDLSIGDRVFTGSGGAKPIKWIGRRSYLGRQAQCDPEIIPVRIRAGAIADRCPKRDLYISPRHAVFIDGQLIPAAALINGASIDRATGLEEVHYFHIELEDHDLVLAEGALCETFVDDTSRGVFHNIAEYYALYPEANAPRAAVYFAPRMGEGQELEAIRARLAGRAACIDADGRAQAVSLRGVLDLANRTQIEGWGYDRLDPERTLDVVVLCNGAVIAKVSADIYREDLETAGIGDGRHAFKLRLEAPLSHSQRHAVEVRFADDWSLLEEGPMIIEADPTPSRGALGELGGNLDALTHSRISGWAQDAAQPSHPVALIISVGERVLGRVVANRFRSDLLDARIGDGRHAFDLVIPQGLRRDQDQVIRIQREADGRDLPGTPQILAAPLFDAADREAILAQAFSGGERLEDDERAVALLARHTEALLARRAERTGGKVEREALAAHRRRWGGDPALPLTTEDWTEPKLRVLVIDDQVVDPAEDAGSVALVSHMRALKALDYDVVFAAAGAFEDRGRLDRLAAHEEIAVCGKPHYTCVEDVMSRHRGDFDLIYLHRLTNAQRYQALAKAYCPKAWVVFSVADLQHVRLAGQAKIEARPELLALSRAMERAELDAAAQADLTITHSASEAALLHRQRPNAKVAVIPFAPSVRSPPPPFGQRSGLAFIGSFGHAPNPDAVWWLASTILPMVWTEDPNVTCLIVGHGWTQEALPEVDSRLKILGPVDDLSDVFDKVRLTVAPLQFGAGIKGKVLESFASGVPCVMSEVAADGLPLSLPLRVLIGSRAEDMAELILGCHSNERANEKLSLEGRAWVQQRFSQDEVTRALGEALGHAPADALREAG
jgi:glycosyltransferase involved in cell wall biosynthesis